MDYTDETYFDYFLEILNAQLAIGFVRVWSGNVRVLSQLIMSFDSILIKSNHLAIVILTSKQIV